MTSPERPVFIGFHLTKKENQDRKSGPNWFGSVQFCGFNRSLGPDFQALGDGASDTLRLWMSQVQGETFSNFTKTEKA